MFDSGTENCSIADGCEASACCCFGSLRPSECFAFGDCYETPPSELQGRKRDCLRAQEANPERSGPKRKGNKSVSYTPFRKSEIVILKLRAKTSIVAMLAFLRPFSNCEM